MNVFDTIKSWFSSATPQHPVKETPLTVGRIAIVKIRCTVCHEPFEDRDLVIWDDNVIGKTDHLGCRFVVQADDGGLQDIVTGEPVYDHGDRCGVSKGVWDAYLAEIDK